MARPGWITHVVRNDGPEGTRVESPHLTARQAFRLRRASVYTRRKMRLYGLAWQPLPSLSFPRWRLVFDNIEAVAANAGLMSYCWIEVDGKAVRARWHEEDFAGWGGFQIALLRGTQHVILLIEERARFAEEVMDGSP